ncbi:unnamed protein product [Paramecium pentaurelia]|uniref:Uncharacterized protein n=1 Tax=Paramecium pentaurelia TaxID=43138 RepID=A0A8S1XTA3_9CILI|nr:unnamed protein product [Paramecium pentaurelia]
MQDQQSMFSVYSNPWNKQNITKEKGYLLAKSIDKHPEFKTEILDAIGQQQQTRNIFKDPVSMQLCKYDSTIGPKLENNKIVIRSIVGKPDIFKRKLSLLTGQDPKSSSRRTFVKGNTTNTFRNNNNTIKTQQVYTGEELLAKVNLIEKHLFESRLKEDQEIMNMPFQKKQILLKETRALEEYLKLEKEQSNLLIGVTKQSNKDPSKSVMIDCYRFRRKQEYCNTNDSLHRNNEDKTFKILEIDDDSGYPLFMMSQNDEVIRKPSIINQDETTQSILKQLNDEPVYRSFSSKDYLKSQSNRYTKIASDKINMNIDNLIVQGQSKLDQEIKFDINAKYLLQPIDKGNKEETITENYSGYYKINFK